MAGSDIFSRLEQVNESVFFARSRTCFIDRGLINWLQGKARDAKNKRARICFHSGADAPVHEMLVAVHRESYIPPQIHPDKDESFHLVSGTCDVVLFDDLGSVADIVRLDADLESGCAYFYRVGAGVPHVIRVYSEQVVFHEVAKGPVTANSNLEPEWLPKFASTADARRWLFDLC